LFYAIVHGKVGRPGWTFQHILKDIETLNQWAMEGRLEVTAMSLHAYAHVSDRYAILPYGTSMGVRYGPVLISRAPAALESLKGARIAVPGTLTTAFGLLKMVLPEFTAVVTPFDRIMPMVKAGQVDAGLLIHEGQLTYREEGLYPVVDLGVWWQETTGLPLPLGVNAIRKDLGEEVAEAFAHVLGESIRYGRDHWEEAIGYAMQYGRGLSRPLADRFVNMYVNAYADDLGDDGRAGIALLLKKLVDVGMVKKIVHPEFVRGGSLAHG